MSEQLSLTDIRRCVVGDRITKIRRVYYVLGDTIQSRNGPVEVTVGDHAPLVFDAGPDGEELVCRGGPWLDPFEDGGVSGDRELGAENARYVAEYGKWTVFDAGDDSEFRAIVGHRIEALTVDTVGDGKPVTAVFDLGDRSVVLAAMGDELVTTVRAR
ncbi:hypothetical protein A0W34_31255 (plasmid) [Rhodococcus sp. BH4]|uniref:hypothetical protein n=1 Tax=Rhodococcus sp. BH4 TaxID=1807790 RepID=UPI0009C3B8EF|nr:hypothetical protein [Rhodococcus sp. BH4]ARE37975.1 hypothetical protein A0W34_31255 [Rhodococcus sp. BH4]